MNCQKLTPIGLALALSTLLALPAPAQNDGDLFDQTRILELIGQYERRLEQPVSYLEEEALRLQLADAFRRLEDYVNALRQYRILTEREGFDESPRSLPILTAMAQLLNVTGNTEEAVDIYEQITDLYTREHSEKPEGARANPEYPRTLLDLAALQEAIGRYDDSRQTCYRLLDLGDPGYQMAVFNRLIRLYEYEALSEEELRALVDRLPDGPTLVGAWYRLANAYAERGFHADAMLYAAKVLELRPEFYASEMEPLFRSYAATDRFGELLTLLRGYADAYPEKTIYTRLLFEALCYDGQEETALADLRRKAQQSQDFRLKEELTRFLLGRKRFAEAETLAQSLLRMAPHSPVYLDLLAETLRGQGRTEDALALWRRKLQENPTERGYLQLAEILRAEGRTGESIALLQDTSAPGINRALFYNELLLMLVQESRMGEAVDILVRIMQERPGELRLARVNTLSAINDVRLHEAAMAAIEDRMKRRDPNLTAAVRAGLIELYLDIAGSGQLHARAIDFLSSPAVPRPESALRLYNLGRDLIQSRDFVNAVSALGATPPDSRVYADAVYLRATALAGLKRYEEARDELARFVGDATAPRSLRPPDLQMELAALYQLASIGIARHSPGETLLWLRRIDTMALPSSALLQTEPVKELFTGHALSQLGSLDEALTHYRRVQQIGNHEVLDASMAIANVLLWKGETDDALRVYHSVATQDLSANQANDALARRAALLDLAGASLEKYALATLFAWQGRAAEAEEAWRELAIQTEGTDTEGWAILEIARMRSAQGDFEAAAREYGKIIERTEHPVLSGLARLALAEARAGQEAIPNTLSEDAWRQVILAAPDSLYAAIARRKLQGNQDALPY